MRKLARLIDWLSGRSGTVAGFEAVDGGADIPPADYVSAEEYKSRVEPMSRDEIIEALKGMEFMSAESDHECGPECQPIYTDEHIDATAHDLAQCILGKEIDREEWEDLDNFTNVQAFRRAARYVLGSMMNMRHEEDGGHRPGEYNCPECALIEGFVNSEETGQIPAPSSGFPNDRKVNEMLKREDPPEHIALKSDLDEIPEGASFSAKITYGTDPANMKHVGWLTEHGLVLKDGVEISEAQRAFLEQTAYDHLKFKPRDLNAEADEFLKGDSEG